jgi:predicted metal-binding protein
MPFSISAPRDHCKGAEIILLDITSTSSSLNEKTDRDTAPGVVVYVCRSCRSEADPNADPRPGATLAQAAIALGEAEGVDVRSVNCLANCKRGLSAAMRSADGWSYMFGSLSEDDAADLLVGARLLSSAPDGLMPWRGRPDSLKRGLIARIPPLNFTEETS